MFSVFFFFFIDTLLSWLALSMVAEEETTWLFFIQSIVSKLYCTNLNFEQQEKQVQWFVREIFVNQINDQVWQVNNIILQKKELPKFFLDYIQLEICLLSSTDKADIGTRIKARIKFNKLEFKEHQITHKADILKSSNSRSGFRYVSTQEKKSNLYIFLLCNVCNLTKKK